MSIELIVALISALVAVSSATMSFYGQVRTKKLEHELARKRETETKEYQAKVLLAKYRDPLLRSAFDLQSRFYSIVERRYLQLYYDKSDWDREYAINSTLFVIAEFMGWQEILRREIRFLDLGDIEENRQVAKLLNNVQEVFLSDGMDLTFRLFRGQQRALGELMLKDDKSSGQLDCIGLAKFAEKIEIPEFSRWVSNLKADVEKLAKEPGKHEARLIVVQHALIDLINFLDPEDIRIPKQYRTKIESFRRV